MLRSRSLLFFGVFFVFQISLLEAAPPTGFELKNAAVPGTIFPWVGAGSGGYTGNASQPYGAYPECFNGCEDAECIKPDSPSFSGCGEYVDASIATFLQLGGRRIDSADSYHNQFYAGRAVLASGIPRNEIFFVSKVGPYLPMGFADTQTQITNILSATGLDYVDLVLIHWPDCLGGGGVAGCLAANSSEPVCQYGQPQYDSRLCRLQTWDALTDAFNSKKARAIGVSNFNSTQLQELKDAGKLLPSVNQIPFYTYHSSVQNDTIAWCRDNGVLVNGYSPFGVPDRKTFPPPMPALTPLLDPIVVNTAKTHGTSPANIILAWHYASQIPFNPRSQNAIHMLENLGEGSTPPWWTITLSDEEMNALSTRPQA
jgi:diketogulonate reductase-like aldo/keto reductase